VKQITLVDDEEIEVVAEVRVEDGAVLAGTSWLQKG